MEVILIRYYLDPSANYTVGSGASSSPEPSPPESGFLSGLLPAIACTRLRHRTSLHLLITQNLHQLRQRLTGAENKMRPLIIEPENSLTDAAPSLLSPICKLPKSPSLAILPAFNARFTS